MDDLNLARSSSRQPFHRLMADGRLLAQRHEGFWAPMDTLKDKQWLEGLHESGEAPWQLWTPAGRATASSPRGRLMLPLLARRAGDEPLRLLAIGAHADDIEIGCGGTILKLIGDQSAGGGLLGRAHRRARRAAEAASSADALLDAVPDKRVILKDFRDGFFPYDGAEIKDFFEELKRELSPDLILTHRRADLHQDHRVTCELTWNTFRDHLILEYEIPKYDGDMRSPNLYRPPRRIAVRPEDRSSGDLLRLAVPKRWFEDDSSPGCSGCAGWSATRPLRLPKGSTATTTPPKR